MKVEQEELIKKILAFWSKFDGKNFTLNDLKNEFNYKELGVIYANDHFYRKYKHILKTFMSKFREFDNVFTDIEAYDLIKLNYPYDYFLPYLSDDKLLSLVDKENERLLIDIAEYLKSDEAKLKVIAELDEDEFKVEYIARLSSDDLKFQFLKKVSSEYREEIVASFKDDRYVEKYLGVIPIGKANSIAKFSSDSLKAKYLRKYFRLISSEDKAAIIASFKDESYIFNFLVMVNDSIRANVIKYRNNPSETFIDNVIAMISDAEEIADLIDYIDEKIVFKYVDRISNYKKLLPILRRASDENIIKFFDYLDYKGKIEIIRVIADPVIKFEMLSRLDDKKVIFNLIDHFDYFPPYSQKYEYIIDMYAERYNLNREHLLMISKKVSLSVLKVINNNNLVKIINSSPEVFNKIINIFDKEKLRMNSDSLNNVFNAVLQRRFRLVHSDVILLFPSILNAIENNDKGYVILKLKEVGSLFETNSMVLANGWNMDQFVELLMSKDATAINSLHEITTKYITVKRNGYVQENLRSTLDMYSNNKFDKNDLSRYMIQNYPIELLMSLFNERKNWDINDLTEQEYNLLHNDNLLKSIILYKKNPVEYSFLLKDVKDSFKTFDSLFERFFANQSTRSYPDASIDRKIPVFKDINSEYLIDILMSLDIDKLEKHLFSNPQLYDAFFKIWESYKNAGWGQRYEELLSSAGIVFSPETVANFIQYFGVAYETMEMKVQKGELVNISITSLLDLASCYSSESKKYSYIFGEENFKFIASNPSPNASSSTKDERLERSLQYLSKIRKRKYVTVPPIDRDYDLGNDKSLNVVVGNFSNPINLTYGERTGACMRIGGAGESLYDFCLNNENGFHIRFTNPRTGAFVSRVSGFRNGNSLFLNQLRCPVDESYSNEDVVEACKLVSEELIKLSMNSDFPIENVTVTPSLAMQDSGMKQVDLRNVDSQKGMKDFYTDISSTFIILATADKEKDYAPFKVGPKSVSKYNVIRDKLRTLYNEECQEYVAHLKCLDQYLSGISIDNINVSIDESLVACLAGEDWCVTVDKAGNIKQFVMKNSTNEKVATAELQGAMAYLKESYEREIAMSDSISVKL